jgi:hypothetical protein
MLLPTLRRPAGLAVLGSQLTVVILSHVLQHPVADQGAQVGARPGPGRPAKRQRRVRPQQSSARPTSATWQADPDDCVTRMAKMAEGIQDVLDAAILSRGQHEKALGSQSVRSVCPSSVPCLL